jgi:vacuolar-type H+-ATPase subunit E/Vma4
MSETKLKEVIQEKGKEEIARLHKEHNLKMEDLRDTYREKSMEIEEWFLKEKERIENTACRYIEKRFQREKVALELEIDSFLSEKSHNYAIEVALELWEESKETFLREKSNNYKGEDWSTVYVNARDVELAKKYFKNCSVEATEEIKGGFILENKSKTFLVDNSLESRFDKIWEEILPDIIRDIYEKLGD